MTSTGKLIYGALIGAMCIIITGASIAAFAEGIMLAILFANVFAPTDRLLRGPGEYPPEDKTQCLTPASKRGWFASLPNDSTTKTLIVAICAVPGLLRRRIHDGGGR